MSKETKLTCPCGGNLKQIGTTHTGHTHQCGTCGELHAPFGHEEPAESVRYIVALEYDTIQDLKDHLENMPEEFPEVLDNAALFRFNTDKATRDLIRSLLRVVAGMDTPLNRDLNMIEEGDKRFTKAPDNFKRVYCDVCEQKIYLEEFPTGWDHMEQEQRDEYLTGIVDKYKGRDSLASWNNTGGPIEEWVTVCKGCGK